MKIALLPLLLLFTACTDVELWAAHGPAVDSTGHVDRGDDVIELSAGTALAIECTVEPAGAPCEDIEAVIDDEGVAASYRAHLDGFIDRYYGGDSARSGFVVVGRRTGTTKLEVLTADGDLDYRIRVIE